MEPNPIGRIRRVVSGGQTGVDRAALDAAMTLGIPVGGWCPKGRRAEDGVIDARYPLTQTPLPDYAQRTAWNVRDSDGTLILRFADPSPGTNLTMKEAQAQGKALLHLDLTLGPERSDVTRWMAENEIRILNVAGPRESEAPGVYEAAFVFLEEVLGQLR